MTLRFVDSTLRKLDGMMVVQDGGEPVAVLMRYEDFIQLQKTALDNV